MLWLLGTALATQQEMDPEKLVYAVPDHPHAVASEYTFKTWKRGAQVWVATKDAGLYAEPEQTSYKPLGIDTPLTIVGVGTRPRKNDQGRVDLWYRVRTEDGKREGYVFGSKLTDTRFIEDFDQDGQPETALAHFNALFEVEVTFVDGRRTQSVTVPSRGGMAIVVRGGLAHVGVVSGGEAGVPLVWVHRYVETPAEFATAWLSYAVPTDRKQASAKVALDLEGSDAPPDIQQYTVTFHPNKTATLDRMVASGEGPPERSKATVYWHDGVYRAEP